MIALKILIFASALIVTILLIEDAIERIILHSKKDFDMLHAEYIAGILETINGGLLIWAIILWTTFYCINII